MDSNGKEEVLGLLVGKAADKGGQIKTRSQWLVDSGGQPGSPETGSDPGYGSDEEVESQVTTLVKVTMQRLNLKLGCETIILGWPALVKTTLSSPPLQVL